MTQIQLDLDSLVLLISCFNAFLASESELVIRLYPSWLFAEVMISWRTKCDATISRKTADDQEQCKVMRSGDRLVSVMGSRREEEPHEGVTGHDIKVSPRLSLLSRRFMSM